MAGEFVEQQKMFTMKMSHKAMARKFKFSDYKPGEETVNGKTHRFMSTQAIEDVERDVDTKRYLREEYQQLIIVPGSDKLSIEAQHNSTLLFKILTRMYLAS